MFPLFLPLPKKGPRTKWTIISTSQTKIKICLSSFVARVQPTAVYVEACKVFGFYEFRDLLLNMSKLLPYVGKKYHKN